MNIQVYFYILFWSFLSHPQTPHINQSNHSQQPHARKRTSHKPRSQPPSAAGLRASVIFVFENGKRDMGNGNGKRT